MKVQLVLAFLLGATLISCGSSGGSSAGSSEETTGTCQNGVSGHAGCCSSHGGFGGQCTGGKVCATASGRLVCSDGTISPTCVLSEDSFSEFTSGETKLDATEILSVTCT